MLVLTRRTDERVFVTAPDGSVLILTVSRITATDNSVRLGFEAPMNWNIRREEVEPKRTSMGHVSPNGLVDTIRERIEQATKDTTTNKKSEE